MVSLDEFNPPKMDGEFKGGGVADMENVGGSRGGAETGTGIRGACREDRMLINNYRL